MVWDSDGSPGNDQSQTSIIARRYDSNGNPVGADFQVNSYTTNVQIRPAVSMEPNGSFVVVWDSDGSYGNDPTSYSIQAQRYDSSGIAIGTQFQVNSLPTNNQSYLNIGRPAVLMHPDGTLLVLWENNGSAGSDQSGTSIQGRRFSWRQAMVPLLSPVGLVGLSLLLLAAGSALVGSRAR